MTDKTVWARHGSRGYFDVFSGDVVVGRRCWLRLTGEVVFSYDAKPVKDRLSCTSRILNRFPDVIRLKSEKSWSPASLPRFVFPGRVRCVLHSCISVVRYWPLVRPFERISATLHFPCLLLLLSRGTRVGGRQRRRRVSSTRRFLFCVSPHFISEPFVGFTTLQGRI